MSEHNGIDQTALSEVPGSTNSDTMSDADLDAAVAMLGVGNMPSRTSEGEAEDLTDSSGGAAAHLPLSPTLAQLDEKHRPLKRTACETCPHSIWNHTPDRLACWCRVMYAEVWTTNKPTEVLACDGPHLLTD